MPGINGMNKTIGSMSASLAFDKAQDCLGKSLGLAGDTLAKYFDSHDNGVNYRPAGQQWPVCTP